MKIVLFKLTAMVLMLSPVASLATPILDVQDGMLMGASGVEVNDMLYNVEFLEGTCVDLFTGCDEAIDFMFNTAADALAASQALLDQVFLDGINGLFNDLPGLTNGCESDAFVCRTYTMYGLTEQAGTTLGLAASFNNYGGQFNVFDDTSLFGVMPDFNFGNQPFARWSLSSSQVAEPSTLTLALLGLFAMLSIRNK